MEPEWEKWCRENMPPTLFKNMESDMVWANKWRDKKIRLQEGFIQELMNTTSYLWDTIDDLTEK